MRTTRALLAATALMSIAAAAPDPGVGSGGGPADNATAEKFYLATAESRAVDPTTKEKTKVTFVVSGSDYKTAWARAREVTRVGTAHFQGKCWTDKTREKEFELVPGSYTVQSLDSLQERRSKQPAVTLDNLLATLEERNISIPAKMREVIDELRERGPITGNGEGAQAEGATGTTG